MKTSLEELGNIINAHSCLNCTADTLRYLRRHNTDAFIIDSLEYCSVGNKKALLSILDKKVSAMYSLEDKVNLDNTHRDD